jgi:hypothetical protein
MATERSTSLVKVLVVGSPLRKRAGQKFGFAYWQAVSLLGRKDLPSAGDLDQNLAAVACSRENSKQLFLNQ